MRRVLACSGLVLALCVPLSACGGGGSPAPSVDKSAVSDLIKNDERQLLEDFRSKDPAKIGSHYADDAVMVISGSAPMEGREAIAKGLGNAVADPAFALDFGNKKTDVAASGDLAYARGTYNVSATDPATKSVVTQSGVYMTVYKKQSDGSWKIVEDITSEGPAAAPAAAGKPAA
jgi:uncharacterized protein (TIGR02246 family)